MTTDDSLLGHALLVRARNAIGAEFGLEPKPEPEHQALAEKGATFVTLTGGGHGSDQLRGCIGTLEAWRSLEEDVRANARSAAFRDPRFMPLRQDEFSRIHVEVSLLTTPVPLKFRDEEDALRQLRPHVDGLIFQYRDIRSTFLPQVWESLTEPKDFLFQLKCKAGVAGYFWAPDVRLFRYEVRKWKEL